MTATLLITKSPGFNQWYWCLNNIVIDLSAGVDVYSDWVDACDIVAKEAADAPKADDGIGSYDDLVISDTGRRNSDMQIDRHLVAAVEEDEKDGQRDYNDDD